MKSNWNIQKREKDKKVPVQMEYRLGTKSPLVKKTWHIDPYGLDKTLKEVMFYFRKSLGMGGRVVISPDETEGILSIPEKHIEINVLSPYSYERFSLEDCTYTVFKFMYGDLRSTMRGVVKKIKNLF